MNKQISALTLSSLIFKFQNSLLLLFNIGRYPPLPPTNLWDSKYVETETRPLIGQSHLRGQGDGSRGTRFVVRHREILYLARQRETSIVISHILGASFTGDDG